MRHLDRISTVAVENLPIQRHASLPIIPPFSSRLVQKPIAMHLMMPPALSFAKLLNMTLFFVPTAISIYHFPLAFHYLSIYYHMFPKQNPYTQLIKHFILHDHNTGLKNQMVHFLHHHHQLNGLIRRFSSRSILLHIFSYPVQWHSFSLLPLSLCLQQRLRHWYEKMSEENTTQVFSWKEERNKKDKEMKIVRTELCGTHEGPKETNKCRNYSSKTPTSWYWLITNGHPLDI